MATDPTKKLIAESAARRAQGLRLRAKPEDRKAALDAVLLKIVSGKAPNGGIAAVTLARVAQMAECSTSLLGLYYKGSLNMRVAAINLLAANGDSPALRRVFEDGFNPKAKGLKLPKGFKP